MSDETNDLLLKALRSRNSYKVRILDLLKDNQRGVDIFFNDLDGEPAECRLPNDFKINGIGKDELGRDAEVKDAYIRLNLVDEQGVKEIKVVSISQIFAIEDVETGVCAKFDADMPKSATEQFKNTPNFVQAMKDFSKIDFTGVEASLKFALRMGGDEGPEGFYDYLNDISAEYLFKICNNEKGTSRRVRFIYQNHSFIDPINAIINLNDPMLRLPDFYRDLASTRKKEGGDYLEVYDMITLSLITSSQSRYKSNDLGLRMASSKFDEMSGKISTEEFFIPWRSIIMMEFVPRRVHGAVVHKESVVFPENAKTQDQKDFVEPFKDGLSFYDYCLMHSPEFFNKIYGEYDDMDSYDEEDLSFDLDYDLEDDD